MEHHLKIWTWAFDDVVAGVKRFEIRWDDRGFRRGDTLVLHEIDGDEKTGRTVTVRVLSVYRKIIGLSPGFALLSIALPDEGPRDGGPA